MNDSILITRDDFRKLCKGLVAGLSFVIDEFGEDAKGYMVNMQTILSAGYEELERHLFDSHK